MSQRKLCWRMFAMAIAAVCAMACGAGDGASNPDGGLDSTSPDGSGDSANLHRDGSGSGGTGGSGGADGSSVDGGTGDAASASVLMYHNNLTHDGHYVDPMMTPDAAAGLAIDTTFAGNLTLPAGGLAGVVWAQPLYVEHGYQQKGTFYVADDADNVYALDETTGGVDWSVAVDTPATSYGSGCGQDPGGGGGPGGYIGITGTPVIDLPNRVIYLVAVHAAGASSPISTYKIHALSIDTGGEINTPAGWPIDMSVVTSAQGVVFNPPPQSQRGALALVNGYLYIPFGGEVGDCGTYNGWVASVPTANPAGVTGYTTGVAGRTPALAGIWAVGGLASDGTDVFAATGNGGPLFAVPAGSTWGGDEAVLRFTNGSAFSKTTTDYFAPSNWIGLSNNDLDLGGTGPLVIDVAGTTSPSSIVVAYGKSGVVHVLDRSNLGGIGTGNGTTGEGVYSAKASSSEIINGPVAYTSGGMTYTAFEAGGNLTALAFATAGIPSYTQAWSVTSGQGSPIVTTTDATGSNPIVWMSGSTVTAWNGTTGATIFGGGAISLQGVTHWTTPIDVKGRLFVGAGTQLYALATK
jgi:hypothetical protein